MLVVRISGTAIAWVRTLAEAMEIVTRAEAEGLAAEIDRAEVYRPGQD